MVVCHDITVGRDNHSRTCSLTLRSLYLAFLCAAISPSTKESAKRVGEKVAERVALHVNGLYLRVLHKFDVNNRR